MNFSSSLGYSKQITECWRGSCCHLHWQVRSMSEDGSCRPSGSPGLVFRGAAAALVCSISGHRNLPAALPAAPAPHLTGPAQRVTPSTLPGPILLHWPRVFHTIRLAKERCVCSWMAFPRALITMVTQQFTNITRISLSTEKGAMPPPSNMGQPACV